MSSYLQIFQLNVKTVLFQIIQISLSTKFFVYTQLNDQTVLFQTIQFSISTQFSSIWPLDRTLSGATTQGQSGTGIDGNEGVHCIPQSSIITGALPSDCLMSYPEYSSGKSYSSAEMQSVYSSALHPDNRTLFKPSEIGLNSVFHLLDWLPKQS